MIAPLQGPSTLRPLLFRMSKPAYILRPDPGATQVPYVSAFQQFYHWPYLGVFYAHMRHHKPHCRAGSSRTFIATNLLIRAPHARSFEDSSGVTNAILAIYGRRPTYQDCCANTGPFCRLHRASHPGLRINTRSVNARRSISAEITLRRTVSSAKHLMPPLPALFPREHIAPLP